MNLKLLILNVTAMLLFIPGLTIAGDIIIIGNKSVVESKLNKQDLKNIFLGKKTVWSDDKKIVFVTQDNPGISDKFLTEYINKTPAQYAAYWRDM